MKKFYAIAVEEDNGYTIVNDTLFAGEPQAVYPSLQNAKSARMRMDTPEALMILRCEVVA
jgi:hypothetical protein